MTDPGALAKQVMGLGRLSQLEWEVRQADGPAAVAYIAANDTHRIVGYDHALVWLARSNAIAAVSGGLKVEPPAPQIVFYAALAQSLAGAEAVVQVRSLAIGDVPVRWREAARQWMPAGCTWVPLPGPNGVRLGGMFVQRATPFNEAEQRLLARLGSAYGQTLAAHAAAGRPSMFARARKPWLAAGLALLAAVVLAIPVPMIALSDARIVPAEPHIVAAPVDGIIERILVKPNEIVRPGQPLLRYDRTELASAEEIAARRLAILMADRRRAEAQGLSNPKARAEIGALAARQAEGEVELANARQRLARTDVRAPQDGIALIDDPIAWQGRPVRIGERILAVANPAKVRIEIRIAPEDVLVASPGAAVQLFLASAPATPIAARIRTISHEAHLVNGASVAFLAEADIDAAETPPRLGLTGTAKIYGEQASIAYLLARKPLAGLRRLLGL